MSNGYLQLSPDIIDPTKPRSAEWLNGKNVLATGAAGGLGAAVIRSWAALGANITLGDINPETGAQLIAELRTMYPKQTFHFQQCNVTSWESQAALFEFADSVSEDRGIHLVYPNAGVCTDEECWSFDFPDYPEGTRPEKPSLRIIDINTSAVMYSTYLALTYLGNSRNTRRINSGKRKASDSTLLLISSIAGVIPAPSWSLYSASKHAIVGLFRSNRLSGAKFHGVRVNMLCPYFVGSTGMVAPRAERIIAASSPGVAELSDVVEGAKILAGDPTIVGRSLVVSPKIKARFSAEGEFEPKEVKDTDVTRVGALWDCSVDDEKTNSLVMQRMVTLFTTLALGRSWWRWITQVFYGGGNLEYR